MSHFTPVVLPHPDSLDFEQIWSFFPEETEEISEVRHFQRRSQEFLADYERRFEDEKVGYICFDAFGIYMSKLRRYVDYMNAEIPAKSSTTLRPSLVTSETAEMGVSKVPTVPPSSIVTRGAILALSAPLTKEKVHALLNAVHSNFEWLGKPLALLEYIPTSLTETIRYRLMSLSISWLPE